MGKDYNQEPSAFESEILPLHKSRIYEKGYFALPGALPCSKHTELCKAGRILCSKRTVIRRAWMFLPGFSILCEGCSKL